MDAWEPWSVGGGPSARELVQGERVIITQAGVGLYEGNVKAAARSCGIAVLTTHRLAYIDDRAPRLHSAFVRLAQVRQTEHYAGFLRSSPKVILTYVCRRRIAWTCALCHTFHDAATLDARCTQCGAVAPPTDETDMARVCSACTFANHEELTHCEMCGTSLRTDDPVVSLKLSFRQGGDTPFYLSLREAIQARAWTLRTLSTTPGVSIAEAQTSAPGATPSSDALADLHVLMRRAREMVDMAESLRAQLDHRSQAKDVGHVDTMLQSAMVQLGLEAPAVTPDMVRNEKAYHRALARELAGMLLGEHGLLGPGYVVHDGTVPPAESPEADTRCGLLALDEVWGLWNRARGVALVPPRVMRAAVAFLPEVTCPRVSLRVLRSGWTVLHTPRFEDAALERRVLHYLDEEDAQQSGLTTSELAAHERLTPVLVKSLLESIELSLWDARNALVPQCHPV
ncbi:amidase [Malassezia nana]|uniref:Vacuolar protein-sorting-associated protein 36 n=1 Tax=Malassezia nana TaxID=180528 RepID=A0AAF0EPA7_9BASI|nr:amidase [Malassezia nana]